MALILDTNALSELAEGDLHLRKAIENEDDLALPAVVLGEFLYGIRQSRKRSQYESWLDVFRDRYPVLSIGPETAAAYADIRAELRAAGRPMPSNDLWVAALGREHRFGIVTRDRHFKAVSGITLVPW
jgi:predicted nucleic acid-binding protein